MDIHLWLENTGQEIQNPLNDTHAFNQNTSWLQHEHKRKRSSGSTIGPFMPKSAGSNASRPSIKKRHRRKGRLASRSSPSSRALSGWSSSSSSSLSSSSSSASSSVSSSTRYTRSVESYRKRARRKTNPHKYKPQLDSHEQRTRTDGRARAKDSRKKKRKNKRKRKLEEKDEAGKKKKRRKNERPKGIVQNFRAKNVAKDRLTLNPTKIGLYAQGRASGPKKTQGLPDLVFSEMKFLQKDNSPEFHQSPQATTKHEDTKAVERKDRKKSTNEEKPRHRKKDRKHVEDEEISTYFGITKAHGHEQSNDQPAQAYATHNHSNMVRNALSDPVEQELTKPSVALPEKPFLGFGSSGNRPLSVSHLTCSEPREQTISSLGPSLRQQRLIIVDALDQLISGQGVEGMINESHRVTNPRSRGGHQVAAQDARGRETEDKEMGQPRPDEFNVKCMNSGGHASFMRPSAESLEQSHPTNSKLSRTAPFPKPGVTISTAGDLLIDADGNLQASCLGCDEIVQDAVLEQVQTEKLLPSSPLGKLLKKCSAVVSPPLEMARVLSHPPADIAQQDYSQTTSMGPQKSSAVFSLPVPDIYIHQSTSPHKSEAIPDMIPDAEGALLTPNERLSAGGYDRAGIGMDEIFTLDAFHRNDGVYSLQDELAFELHRAKIDFGGGYASEEREDEGGEHHDMRGEETPNELAGFWRPNRLY